MTLVIVSSRDTPATEDGEVMLAAGANLSMRLWRDEQPHDKQPHRSPYETIGYVIAGRAELTIEGQTAPVGPGDSYLVPANAEHTYRIIEPFTAVECTSPPLRRPKEFRPG